MGGKNDKKQQLSQGIWETPELTQTKKNSQLAQLSITLLFSHEKRKFLVAVCCNIAQVHVRWFEEVYKLRCYQ